MFASCIVIESVQFYAHCMFFDLTFKLQNVISPFIEQNYNVFEFDCVLQSHIFSCTWSAANVISEILQYAESL